MMTKTKNIIFRRKTILKEKKIMNSTTKPTSSTILLFCNIIFCNAIVGNTIFLQYIFRNVIFCNIHLAILFCAILVFAISFFAISFLQYIIWGQQLACGGWGSFGGKNILQRIHFAKHIFLQCIVLHQAWRS